MKLPCCLNRSFVLNCLPLGAIVLYSLCLSSPVQSQIIPDNTLPTNSRVTINGTTLEIDQGTAKDSNLFHSFETFSIPTGNTALFKNSTTIQNIITRITGNFPSSIDGIIRVDGSANLFLINPNGIVFGPNAALDIGGSFFASTANRINFADGTTFSATNPDVSSTLTVTVPVGLGFGDNPSPILVQGIGHTLTVSDQIFSPVFGAGMSSSGLQTQSGKTLALVGGDVILDGGVLTAPGGRIELGSVNSGTVNLHPTLSGWTLSYEGVSNFGTIQLSQRALADASGLVGGSIHVQGARVTLSDGSKILIQSQQPNPTQAQSSGNINVNASELLELDGMALDGVLRT
ncbi:MAG TPA: filamentous hemagglutinin N-terminal domain-containing protein, partial [Coleofasciculaceae cyanobacterium]